MERGRGTELSYQQILEHSTYMPISQVVQVRSSEIFPKKNVCFPQKCAYIYFYGSFYHIATEKYAAVSSEMVLPNVCHRRNCAKSTLGTTAVPSMIGDPRKNVANLDYVLVARARARAPRCISAPERNCSPTRIQLHGSMLGIQKKSR